LNPYTLEVHPPLQLLLIYAACDYITVHVPLTPDTKEMICADSIAKMKDGVRILNFARGDLVNSSDILSALKSGRPRLTPQTSRATT
jgi:phosphoglycerate dehydrogenase-like enzyme